MSIASAKHLKPISGYRERNIKGQTIMVPITITKAKEWKVRCTRPGEQPVTETFHVTASTKMQASEKAIKLMRAGLRCAPGVAIVTKVTEAQATQVGTAAPSTTPAKFKGKVVNPKAGVTNGRYK